MARRENHDAFHLPLCPVRRGKSGSHLGSREWVRGMRSKFIALPDYPFMIFHHLTLEGQIAHIFSRKPVSLALAKTASVRNQRRGPERLWHDRIALFLRFSQLGKQPLATIHHELKIPDDRRLICENL